MSRHVLAVDPGKLMCGVSIFEDGVLVRATLAKNPIDKPGSDGPGVWKNTAYEVLVVWSDFRISQYLDGYAKPDHIILEIPVIRKQGLQKGSQDDILALAGVDGAIAALFDRPVTAYRPEQWGGQTPKAIKNQRTLKRLSPEELKAIDPKVPKSLLHNVLDSVSVGLYYLGRYR